MTGFVGVDPIPSLSRDVVEFQGSVTFSKRVPSRPQVDFSTHIRRCQDHLLSPTAPTGRYAADLTIKQVVGDQLQRTKHATRNIKTAKCSRCVAKPYTRQAAGRVSPIGRTIGERDWRATLPTASGPLVSHYQTRTRTGRTQGPGDRSHPGAPRVPEGPGTGERANRATRQKQEARVRQCHQFHH